MIRPGNHQPEFPPEKIRVFPNAEGGQSLWLIDTQKDNGILTIQNNVGLVRMVPGVPIGGTPRVRLNWNYGGCPHQSFTWIGMKQLRPKERAVP